MHSQRLVDERKEALLGCCCYIAHSTQDLSCCNGSFCNVMQARVQGGTCPKIMAVPMEQTYKSVCVCPAWRSSLPKTGTGTKSAGACVFSTEGVYLRKLSNRVAAQVQVLQVSQAADDAREACHSIVGA